MIYQFDSTCLVAELTLGFCFLVYLLTIFFSKKVKTFLAHSANYDLLFKGSCKKLAALKAFFTTMAFLMLGICLLQPKWGKKPQQMLSQGRNVLFVLDLSRSMLAQDLLPNRLEFVKIKIRQIFNGLGPERVGLILFSEKAFLHCPFTTDINAFFSFLEFANKSTVSFGSTAIAAGLTAATETFRSVLAGAKNKIVIVLTDGEDFSKDLESSIKMAKNEKINVLFLGTATQEGAPVPILDRNGNVSGHETDASGQVVLTRLNKEFLCNISKKLDGNCIEITETDADVGKIINFVKKFEQERFQEKNVDLYHERQNIFSFAFFILWLLGWLL